MNRDTVDWRGYFAAVPTPFNEDGSLALDLLRELLDFYVEQGLHGVLVNGTTGEWFAQSTEERRRVAETAIDAIGGRIPILIGCTDYTADLVIAHARHAFDAGAAGVTSTPPPYAKPFDDEIVAFYEDIAAGAPDIPLMIYNWVHGTSVEIGTALAERLVEIDTVVAFKDSTPNVEQFYASSRAVNAKVRVFGPYMSVAGYEQLREHGGDGTIGGGSLWGRPDPEFWEAALARRRGSRARARPPHGGAVPEALAARRLGGTARALRERAEGADEAARPAGRDGPAPAAADHRPRRPGGDAGDPLRGRAARAGMRLPVARGPALTISLDGREVTAYEGETVAAVLFAEGIVSTRTTVTGEPRGVFCGMGVCFDCLVIVDGIPNTRACMTPVSRGDADPAPSRARRRLGRSASASGSRGRSPSQGGARSVPSACPAGRSGRGRASPARSRGSGARPARTRGPHRRPR